MLRLTALPFIFLYILWISQFYMLDGGRWEECGWEEVSLSGVGIKKAESLLSMIWATHECVQIPNIYHLIVDFLIKAVPGWGSSFFASVFFAHTPILSSFSYCLMAVCWEWPLQGPLVISPAWSSDTAMCHLQRTGTLLAEVAVVPQALPLTGAAVWSSCCCPPMLHPVMSV